MNRKPVILIFTFVLGLAMIAGAVLTGGQQPAIASAMTELQVSNMTCGSCVSNIQSALAVVDGIGEVEVSVTSGRSRVTYDPEFVNSKEIARVITAAGYPASVRLELSADEYARLQSESEELSAEYVAKIGDRLLPRKEFDALVQLRSGAVQNGKPAFVGPQLKAQVWNELKEREILLAAADKNQVVVQDGEVEVEANRLKASVKDFDSVVTARFGSYDRFLSHYKENMIINRNIEQNVVAGLDDDRARQLRFSEWYRNLQQEIDVVVYDPELKQVAVGGGGCGSGSCCGS